MLCRLWLTSEHSRTLFLDLLGVVQGLGVFDVLLFIHNKIQRFKHPGPLYRDLLFMWSVF